jgi:hypothetical protein
MERHDAKTAKAFGEQVDAEPQEVQRRRRALQCRSASSSPPFEFVLGIEKPQASAAMEWLTRPEPTVRRVV